MSKATATVVFPEPEDNPFPYNDADEKPNKVYYVSSSSYYLKKLIEDKGGAGVVTGAIRAAFLAAIPRGEPETRCVSKEKNSETLDTLITEYKDHVHTLPVPGVDGVVCTASLPKVLVFVRNSRVHPKLNMDLASFTFISKGSQKRR